MQADAAQATSAFQTETLPRFSIADLKPEPSITEDNLALALQKRGKELSAALQNNA
jgi:hypothetical protein